MEIILASKSPRRKQLLTMLFDDFKICGSEIDETVPEGIDIPNIPSYLAVQKALDISTKHPDSLVIGCDTIVACNGEVFRKPLDANEAKYMLKTLSDNVHTVYTGVCYAYKGRTYSFTEETEIVFYPLSNEYIDKYIDTNEPFDKAGAYGIQGLASVFVKGIHGDYYNVVGLPVARMLQEFKLFEKITGEKIATFWG